jgi:hypothetical protein
VLFSLVLRLITGYAYALKHTYQLLLLLRVVCVFCVIANVIDSRLGLSRVTTC